MAISRTKYNSQVIRRHVPHGSVFTTALLPIFMMGWSTHSKITGDDKHGGQGLISWDMEQPFRGTSSHGKMEGQAPHGVQQVLHPVLKHPEHHCKLRAAGWKAAPWKRCWKSCQAMTCTTGQCIRHFQQGQGMAFWAVLASPRSDWF